MRWVDNCGTLVPSVTTVAGWVAPIVFGTPTYEEISAKTWYDRGWCDSALGTPTQSPSISHAAERGTEIHKMIEEAVNGVELENPPKQVDDAMTLVNDLRDHGYRVRAEVKLSCLGGGIAGTADLVAVSMLSKIIRIYDWKTGGFYNTYPVQLGLLESAFYPLVMEGWVVTSFDHFLNGRPKDIIWDVPRGTVRLCNEVAKAAHRPADLQPAYKITKNYLDELDDWVRGVQG